VPIEQAILLIVSIAIIIAVIAAIAVAAVRWRGRANEAEHPLTPLEANGNGSPSMPAHAAALDEDAGGGLPPGTADRAVRVIALLFLAVVAVFVAVSRTFPDTEAAIELLLAAGILFVIFIQDLLPAAVLGRARYWIEAAAAIAFMGLLTGLSGGLSSPFFAGFFLIVAGSTLANNGLAPALLAVLSGVAYGLAGLVVAGSTGLTTTALTSSAFNLVALALLAYLATVTGREQRNAREAAIGMSRFDPLTHLYNRSFFFSVMEREIRRAVRTGRTFSLLMLDVDDLKRVNDSFGHPLGDRLLRAITDVVQHGVRSTDIAARYGGDEIVVLLPETEPAGAFVVAEKLRTDINNLILPADDVSVRTSVSIGLVAYGEEGRTVEGLMGSVDAAMYESKRRGKNQIVGYVTRTERVTMAMGGNALEPARGAPAPASQEAGQGNGPTLTAATVPDTAAAVTASTRDYSTPDGAATSNGVETGENAAPEMDGNGAVSPPSPPEPEDQPTRPS
jgi:diguanylate cyclase (GGDEF)-like protein